MRAGWPWTAWLAVWKVYCLYRWAMRSTMARAVWRSTMDWGFQHWVFRPAPTTWMERSSVWAALFTKGAGRRNQARATNSSAAAAIPARRRGQRSPFPRRGRGASM